MTLLRSSFTTSKMKYTLRRVLIQASSRSTSTIGSVLRRPFPISSTLLINSQTQSWSSIKRRSAHKATVSIWSNLMKLMQPLRRSLSAATPAQTQMVSAVLTGEFIVCYGPKANWPSTLFFFLKIQISIIYQSYFKIYSFSQKLLQITK